MLIFCVSSWFSSQCWETSCVYVLTFWGRTKTNYKILKSHHSLIFRQNTGFRSKISEKLYFLSFYSFSYRPPMGEVPFWPSALSKIFLCFKPNKPKQVTSTQFLGPTAVKREMSVFSHEWLYSVISATLLALGQLQNWPKVRKVERKSEFFTRPKRICHSSHRWPSRNKNFRETLRSLENYFFREMC